METTLKTALVSGAGSGMGRAIAGSLIDLGLQVALVGRDRAKLEETRAGLGDRADRALVEPCDVSDRSAVGSMVERVQKSVGSIDVLVSNAGVNVQQRSLQELDPADWDKMLAINLTGSFNLAHFVLPGMRQNKRGLVVQICSISGKRVSVLGGIGYSASKFGQAALGLCLGREERLNGIRSTVIYPGEVNTPILDRRPVPVEPARRAAILQPEDIAAAVRFLVLLDPRASVPEMVMTPAVDEWF